MKLPQPIGSAGEVTQTTGQGLPR